MKQWHKYNIELPKSRHEFEEFGSGKKGIVMCKDCEAVYYKKSWHHSLGGLKSIEKKDYPIKFVLCPACKMVKDKVFEGKIEINGVPEKFQTELKNLAQGFCKRAFERDPMHRLIEIRKESNNFTILTTENQLAQKLARKIKDVFNKVEIKISHSSEPGDAVFVKIHFKEKSL